jgi:hypothetical protein
VKYGRNEPCPCGSGKKYKHCHLGQPLPKTGKSSPHRELSLHERNRILLHAATDIFGFSKGRSWVDFKRKISGREIRELYRVQASLWTPETDWAAIVPPPNEKLRALYLGDVRPELTLQNIIRFSLYSDEIFVVDPFMNPWIIKPQYNPLENPDQYKSDTIKLVYFLFQLEPWIESGMVKLVPDPGDINVNIKWDTIELARARWGSRKPDKQDLEDAHGAGRAELARVLYALPDDKLLAAVERSGTVLTEQKKAQLLRYARQKLRDDPIAWEQSIADNPDEGQMSFFRGGANLETALLISDLTGAFPYTNMRTRWQEILSARDELSETARVWSPFAKAFQSLEFRFLNNVDTRFAHAIRDDGRLENFRSLLRKVGKEATGVTDLSSLDNYVRDCKDQLIAEHAKAEAEWSKIDEDFFKWAGASVVGGIVGGAMVPNVSSLAAGTIAMLGQLAYRYFKQQQFRRSNPMSVFIDLSRKGPPGAVTVL